MKKKSTYSKIIPILLSASLLAGCNDSASINGTVTNVAQESTVDNLSVNDSSLTDELSASYNTNVVTDNLISYDDDDFYQSWDKDTAIYINLNATTIELSGSGAEVNENVVTISSAGVYVISGQLDEGQLIVDAGDDDTVRLVLNGMDLTNSETSPIFIKNAGKTVISLEEGTINNITDGVNYIFPDSETDEPNATIYSKDDLTINGDGTLNIYGNYNNGIVSKDDLIISGGNINVYSVDDGIIGKDMLLIKSGIITIEAGGDGIKATNDEDMTKGFIAIEDGIFDITAGADGIQAASSIRIDDGDFVINSGGGSGNASKENGENPFDRQNDMTANTTEENESDSSKAIKADSDITILDGTFTIDSADDSLHSNNSITVKGGEYTINTGDDGIHADTIISLEGGTINIEKSYEGIESSVINISDGEVNILSSDDGINVAGGNDQSSIDGRINPSSFSSSGNNKLIITGGSIYVNALGDGLDANGSIYMTGGTVLVSGPTNNGNGAVDYDNVFEITGGYLVAAGSSGMAMAPSEQSTQYSILMTYSTQQSAGTFIHLEDSEGNDIATFSPAKEYQSVLISSPDLKNDETYTLYSGGTSTGNEKDGLYTGGIFTGGSKIIDFTITSTITWLDENGVTTGNNNMMPGGGPNGGRTKGQENGDIQPGDRPDGNFPRGDEPNGDFNSGQRPDGNFQPPSDNNVEGTTNETLN